MLLAWVNKADDALISAGSEITTAPASNIQHEHVSRKWHTASGVTSSYLLFDLGASTACALLAVLGTNLTPSATLRLRASNSDPSGQTATVLDTGTVTAGIKSGYGAAYKSFNSVSARYWRLDLSDSPALDHLEVGRIFLGPYWQPSVNQLYGWSITPLDESRISTSWGGQTFAEERPQRRVLTFVLDFMDEAEMYGNAFTLSRARGIVRDVLAIPDIASAYVSEQAVWGLLSASEPLIHRAARIYRQKFTIQERL
jgi:hypothetical protein